MEPRDPPLDRAPTDRIAADLARLYPDVDADFVADAAQAFEPVAIAGGDTLVRRGDPSDALYIVLAGRFVAFDDTAPDRPLRLGEIGRGELIGEMTVLSGAPRTATVVALRDARLLRISNAAFVRFMQRHPSVMRRFVEVLTRRLSTAAEPRGRVATVALVGAGGLPAATLGAFAARLAHAVATRTTVRKIDAADAARAHVRPDDAAADGRIAAWLADAEDTHALLILVAADARDAWSRVALRHADRVLVVAHSDAADAAPGALEAATDAARDLRGRELVLLSAGPPRAAERWLQPRRVARHHWVCDADAGAIDRLARHLLGRSVGVALGGGGVRALTAIGVLRAFERARVPVDVVAGSSMGAVVGGLTALGHDAVTLHAALRDALRLRPFTGLAWPRHALLSGRRLAQCMHTLFGAARIEDCVRPFVPACCNLTDGTLALPERGPLAHWVHASNAVPGLVPPVAHDGAWYVDGALLDNVPVDAVRDRTAGVVVGVNPSRGDGPVPDASGRAPTLARTLVRAMLLASAGHTRSLHTRAALVLEPPMEGIDVNDWAALDAVIAAGEAHTLRLLDTWSPPERLA
ncbi:MAG: patatin-like phospholipase domain-containing protein [Burkholderiales bacterium]|nr:patatin-like phospholipase domain-containing protein [Burkholderiales bacterium]